MAPSGTLKQRNIYYITTDHTAMQQYCFKLKTALFISSLVAQLKQYITNNLKSIYL